jgi:nucleoside-diphosphate-sugar epimerase
MNILLTGVNGMVGQNIFHNLQAAKYNFLAPNREKLDLLNTKQLDAFLLNNQIDLVIHAAGIVGGIEANMSYPVKYLVENSQMGLNLVNACKKSKIKNFLNLASSCMYPKDHTQPLSEEMILQGSLEPTNEGYALSKILITKLCEYISLENDFLYKTVIPCNLYGEYDNFSYDSSHMIPAVIRKIHEAKEKSIDNISVWGNGEARREFMYAQDFSNFIFFALENFIRMPQNLNVGLGHDFSINEYYQMIAKIIGYDGEFTHDLSKPIGMKKKLLNINKLTNFGWQHQFSLNQGIEETYKFYKRGSYD